MHHHKNKDKILAKIKDTPVTIYPGDFTDITALSEKDLIHNAVHNFYKKEPTLEYSKSLFKSITIPTVIRAFEDDIADLVMATPTIYEIADVRGTVFKCVLTPSLVHTFKELNIIKMNKLEYVLCELYKQRDVSISIDRELTAGEMIPTLILTFIYRDTPNPYSSEKLIIPIDLEDNDSALAIKVIKELRPFIDKIGKSNIPTFYAIYEHLVFSTISVFSPNVFSEPALKDKESSVSTTCTTENAFDKLYNDIKKDLAAFGDFTIDTARLAEFLIKIGVAVPKDEPIANTKKEEPKL